MEALTPWHLLLILIAFVLLAGFKKLPATSRSVGRSLRIFRSEMHAEDGSASPPAGTISTGARSGQHVGAAPGDVG